MFKFNGISSDSMRIVVDEEDLILTKAALRYENVLINGRDGASFNELGYSNVEVPLRLQILDPTKLDEIFSWLNGHGIFEYNGKVTNAYFYNDISPQRLVTIRVAEITFIRSPFWIKKDDEFQTVVSEVFNEGNIYAKPIIRIEKGINDKIDVTIGDVRFTYTFNGEKYVEINCEDYYASYESLNRNRYLEIGFKFPIIKPGKNNIVINSGDPIIKIKNKDRWL